MCARANRMAASKYSDTKEDYYTQKGGKLPMAESIFMRVSEVAEELGVSQSYAYKLVRQLNKELAETGCIIIPGRIDRKFFHEKLYGTRNQN